MIGSQTIMVVPVLHRATMLLAEFPIPKYCKETSGVAISLDKIYCELEQIQLLRQRHNFNLHIACFCEVDVLIAD